jgi:putative membrane protein
MIKASSLFSEEQRRQVETAVAEAETKTSCEIVPVVATCSGRYDRPEDMVGLLSAILAAIAVWLMFPRPSNESGSWDGTPLYVGLLAMIAGVLVAFVAGVAAGNKIGWLRRLFTPREQMREEVLSRAREVFFDKRVHHASGANGMLIYVSLFEHTAVVLGDQVILEKLGQPFLDQLCQQLTADLHRGEPINALRGAIEEAGKRLSGPLPRAKETINELPNALILID